MGTKRTLYLAILLALIVSLVPGAAFAGTTTVGDVTLTTPETYSSCAAPGDTITVTGLTAKNAAPADPNIEYRVHGQAAAFFILEGGARQQFFSYANEGTAEDFTVVIDYPAASQWPVTNPTTVTREIHVDLSFELYAYDKVNNMVVQWVNPTLGPGDDWDVYCQGELPPPPPPPSDPGTGTPGYWKNHPNAWPVDSITIGEDTYTKAQAIKLIGGGDGDKSLTMFRAYVATYLNGLIGNNTSCIDDTLAAAYAWLDKNEVGSKVKASSAAWKKGEPLYKTLDAYNNGLLCAPHRD